MMRKLTSISLESGIQFIKFSLIGILNTGLHYVVFICLFRFVGIHYLVASAIGYGVGLINSFMLNRRWTFSITGGRKERDFCRFVVVNIAALAINIGSLKYLVQDIKIIPEISQIIAIGFSMSINFLGNKFWTFRGAGQANPDFRQ